MLTRVSIENLGPIAVLDWEPAPGLNVIIGPNGSGKTLLLKTLYATVRAQEEYKRGDDPRSFSNVIEDKLYWTYQVDRLGLLVRRGAKEPLRVDLTLHDGTTDTDHVIGFSFSNRAQRRVSRVGEVAAGRDAESVFLPAKEVVSLIPVIKESRGQQKFGFDDPTLDLVRFLEREPTRGKPRFGEARRVLEKELDGRIQVVGGNWVFRHTRTGSGSSRDSDPVSITAEGFKKIAVLDRLIVNQTLSYQSLLFLDEPSSFLHPSATLQFLKVLTTMADHGLQVFIATHSLFVLNAVRLYARSKPELHVPIVSLRASQEPFVGDLTKEMPDNDVVDASLRLYEMEMSEQGWES